MDPMEQENIDNHSAIAGSIPTDNQRPIRETRIPGHLDDFVVGCKIPAKGAPTEEHQDADLCSYKGSTTSQCEASISLSSAQEARLQQQRKKTELEELKRQLEEEKEVDEELRQLDEAAYASRIAAEEEALAARKRADAIAREAHQRREIINTRLSRQRRLREAEKEFNEAQLIFTMANGGSGPDTESQPPPQQRETPAVYVDHDTASMQIPSPSSTKVSVANPPIPPQQLSSPKDALPQPYPTHPADTIAVSTRQMPHSTSHNAPVMSLATESGPCRQPKETTSMTWSSPSMNMPTAVSSIPISTSLPSAAPYPPALPSSVMPTFGQASALPGLHSMPPAMPNMTELLIASSYGVPRPTLPTFTTGKEHDFALLKMALDNLVNVHPHLTEQYKYQVLLGRLGGNILRLAEAYMHDPKPYSAALRALKDKYGQPRQLVQSELGYILNMPHVKTGDHDAFENFALSVHSLVGMLRSLEGEHGYELKCGSHVDRLLCKLPASYRDRFVEHSINRGILKADSDQTYTLHHFADWLQVQSRAKRIAGQAVTAHRDDSSRSDKRGRGFERPKGSPTAVFQTNDGMHMKSKPYPQSAPWKQHKRTAFCPFCDSREHYLNGCTDFRKFTTHQIIEWLKEKTRCWKCGRTHKPENCTLKKPCNHCKEVHLTVLHEAIQQGASKIYTLAMTTEMVYIDQPRRPHNVMLKVVQILLHGPAGSFKTYAVLDDGSMRTMVLARAVQQLNLSGEKDCILLSTIRQEPFRCEGQSIDLHVSPGENPDDKFLIKGAFTADNLHLSEYTYPVTALQKRWPHLSGVPLPSINKAVPMILIGSDNADLIIPRQPVRWGPSGAPVAVNTKLGWTLQGPAGILKQQFPEQKCFKTAVFPDTKDIMQHVERLWQADVLPYCNEKLSSRSKQDQQAIDLLEAQTIRVNDKGTLRYATPLLRAKDGVQFHADKDAVMSRLKHTERRLQKQPDVAKIHNEKVQKLVDAGYVKILSEEEANQTDESWYCPHRVVENNGKHRLVFDCSFEHDGKILNQHLLPGPKLGASLLGVFIRFRQHPVAISGDIQAMFHQVKLLPQDKPLLRFLWRDVQREVMPNVYEWQVLPFGTTCSPCCATFALQKHVLNNQEGNDDVCRAINQSFYVDNCLDSVPSASEAKELVAKMRELLSSGGFNIRQWASNIPSVVEDLPSEARSDGYELWLIFGQSNSPEATLGLRWQCDTDELSYKHRPIEYKVLNMRIIYRILASQYDPIGYLAPFTARAKILVQELWKSKRDWDRPIEPGEILTKWRTWESELCGLPLLRLPRCHTPPDVDTTNASRQIHIFCDASERVYGSVAYLRTEDAEGNIHVTFILSRSRVAPKRQLSMPRLELSAALTGAQLADLLIREMTLPIQKVILWSDSTTVLRWLQSESCRYKVFVGTRVSEIQTLTKVDDWHYVNTADNPADDITRGKTVAELCDETRWRNGPSFLAQPPHQWPVSPLKDYLDDPTELKKSTFCGAVIVPVPQMPDLEHYNTWDSLVKATKQFHDGAAPTDDSPPMTVEETEAIENQLYCRVQQDCFSQEVQALKSGKQLHSGSRLGQLDPEYDEVSGLLRVGGRLRRAEGLSHNIKHPIVLDPSHHITRLLIQNYDNKLLHCGPERVLAEVRRVFWILRGREAIRRHQRQCFKCRKWRSKPDIPKMADLPPARLRIFKPAFYSTGVDCFGPMTVKIGRRTEKRWGIIFKCMTTRAVHLDLLESMDADAFLMAFRRFISRRGKPYELLSDCGTNFKGGEAELKAAFTSMEPTLTQQLAEQKVRFQFNPPNAPHFGGVWEREVKSVKDSLRTVLGDQSVAEPVLYTLLVEVEGILNSKPLGYVSADVADVDPVTPNLLLMGRLDPSLPQVVYTSNELMGRRRWRHTQVLADQFWAHFINFYLPGLQLRQKWRKDARDLTCGDVVMIVDPQLVRAQWPVGRVCEIHPSSDGRVRAAQVRVRDRVYTRPVARLIRLPECQDEDDGGQEPDAKDK